MLKLPSNMNFPKRHGSHSLEQLSETFFCQHLPNQWAISKPQQDYGQDLNIEISEDGEFRGLDLIVQLKSSVKSDIHGDAERLTFRTSTFNYLRNNLRVVLIVKYVQEADEAYWLLLKDIPAPKNEDQETFTIHIPRHNILSKINWLEIKEYVAHVTSKKLSAMN